MDAIILYFMATCVISVTNAQVSDDCKNPLGMEHGGIQDWQLTSSSVYTDTLPSTYEAKEGRLNGQSCWIAELPDLYQWIQVVFDTPMSVSGIILQGSPYNEGKDNNEWVKTYKVQYYFGSSWQYVKDDNENDVFRGNSNRNSPVRRLFASEVRATRIKILPTEWNNYISMRFEILGCEDINECESSPCGNGRCENGVNEYRCTCNTGWRGTNCDQMIDECTSSPCVNGECQDQLNSFTCICQPGYDGTLCDNDINECASSPCVNGQCQDRIKQYRCNCNAGWTGSVCDQMIDECTSSPCVNGECQGKLNSFTCICQPGYDGTLCDNDINECASNPCVNGTCEDGINQFTCDCDNGWTGIRCNQNINECDSNPCVNGTCEDGINQFTCDCDNGWTGIRCDQMTDECANVPCVNGDCRDELNLFTCICEPEYTGTLCDIALTTTINAAVTTTNTIEASTSNDMPDSGSLDKQNSSGSATTALGVAIALVLLLVIIGCTIAFIVVKRRRQQRLPQENSNSKNVLQLDGPYGDTITNIITSPPTKDAHMYSGVTGANEDAVATPPTEELYQDVSEKPDEVQQNMDETYQDITEDATQANQGTNDDDIYQDVQDSEYAYAHVNTTRDKVPNVDGDLVQIYARSQYGGVPRSAQNVNQQEGWVDNDIYAMSDEHPQLKRQPGGDNRKEGWVENDIYARSDEDQLNRQGGENDKEEGWMDNSIYATTDK